MMMQIFEFSNIHAAFQIEISLMLRHSQSLGNIILRVGLDYDWAESWQNLLMLYANNEEAD